MSRWRVVVGLAAILAAMPAARAWGQAASRSPRIGYVYPAGGQQGASFQVKLGGQYLDGARAVLVSGTGVQATVSEQTKPLTTKQASDLKEKLKELTDKRAAALRGERRRGKADKAPETKAADTKSSKTEATWTAEDEKLLAEIRKRLATFVRKPANPAIAETVILEVTVAPDAPPGQRELRLGTSLGLTNPLVFCVGQLPECREKEAKKAADAKGPAPKSKKKASDEPPRGVVKTDTSVTLPAVLNGQIFPGEVDRFRFTARKGQRLVAVASARQLVPYLPDAVPGWFQATLALYDATGQEVAYADDYRFDPDPVLACEIPADGEYVLEIKDAIYRGRDDFVYRITVGEFPRVTSLFPLGGPAGASTTVQVKGWNVPVTTWAMDGKSKQPGVYPLVIRTADRDANPMPFALDSLPECREKEPNDHPAEAQLLTAPVIINGRIDRPEDADVFRFAGRAGQEIVAEVHARRLGSPMDSSIKLTDASGRQLAANDDLEDKGSGLLTHHADSWLVAKLPADGMYYLHISDSQHKGGEEYAYRLRISPPRPDFELRLVPSSITARAGATVPVTVYALRRDGFAGEIAVSLKDPPAGFRLTGGRVPAGQDQVRLTLTVPSQPPETPACLHVDGTSVIDGREVRHAVVPAEDMMQAFAYRHLVPAEELRVAVAGRALGKGTARIIGETPVKIPVGGTGRVQLNVPTTILTRAELSLNDPPEGLSIKEVSPSGEGTAIVFQSDAKVAPGLKGNLIVTASTKKPAAPGKSKQKGQRAAASTALPAIPFEIVKP